MSVINPISAAAALDQHREPIDTLAHVDEAQGEVKLYPEEVAS
jgi:hypothetical protein